MKLPLYLDHAAATPCDPRVFAAMEPYFTQEFYNPSSSYLPARRVKEVVDHARHAIAMTVGAQPSEIIFTSGATESVNLAIHGVMRRYGGGIVASSIEHAAVLRSAEQYPRVVVGSDRRGMVDLTELRAAITDETTLLSIGYANSELGTVQYVRDIAVIIAEARDDRALRGVARPLWLHTDASQAAGYLDLSVSRLGVDMMTLSAGKCYGPKGIGLLWTRSSIQLKPFIFGGGQEGGSRSGTENVAAIVGFSRALDIANGRRKADAPKLAKVRDALQAELSRLIPELVVNGNQKRRLPGHLHIALPGLDAGRAVFDLDRQGIYVATGSACAANKGTRSHVLDAVGMRSEVADGSLRLSLGWEQIGMDVKPVAKIIADTLLRQRRLS